VRLRLTGWQHGPLAYQQPAPPQQQQMPPLYGAPQPQPQQLPVQGHVPMYRASQTSAPLRGPSAGKELHRVCEHLVLLPSSCMD
jgi:hypothetical protein